jgi:predicted metal-dependent HD superfamily phosphohydrolase
MKQFNFKEFIDQIVTWETGSTKEFIVSFIYNSYNQYWRHYHNLNHVYQCLNEFDSIVEYVDHGHAFQYALWYHDIIYIPGSQYNEAMSADIAEFHCRLLIRNNEFGTLAAALITDNRKFLKNDCDFFHDVDYNIFSKDNEIYLQYARNILTEFTYVVDRSIFVQKRQEFLKKILRRKVFRTEYYKDVFLKQAIENIKEEIKMIKGIF